MINYKHKTVIVAFILLTYFFVSSLGPFLRVWAAVNTWDFSTSGSYTFDSTYVEFNSGFAQLKEKGSPAWLDETWKYRKKITIDATKVDEDLSDFPMLIKLNSSNFDFSKSQVNGYDIRFTDADGTTLLSYEREFHNCSNETAEYWVKVPFIDNDVNTDIYVYFTPSNIICGGEFTSLFGYTSGTQQESFLDMTEIDAVSNVNLGISSVTKSLSNPLVEPPGLNTATWDYDKNYNTVLKVDGTYKMWYAGVSNEVPLKVYPAYATSVDGLNWAKPNLGLISYGGNTNNNIYLGQGAFNPSVVYNPDGAADRKYISIMEQRVGDSGGEDLYLYKSSNGTDWVYVQSVDVGAYAESKELVLREDGKWVMYYAYGQNTNARGLAATVSNTTDFAGTWGAPQIVIPYVSATNQMYSIGVEKHNELYYGFVSNYNSTTEQMHMDLYISRDGLSWSLKKDQWVPIGTSGAWDDEMILNGKSLVQEGNDWRFYYSGFAENHAAITAADSRIGLATVGYERIGYAFGNGTVTSSSFTPTSDLFINVNPTDYFGVEVLDASDDSVLTGFSINDFDQISTDTYSTEATWNGNSLPSGSPVKLKFYLDSFTLDPLSKPDGASPSDVWDANYKAVLHMSDDPVLTTKLQDSTSNNSDGTKTSTDNPAEASGKFNDSQNFNSLTDMVTLGDTAAMQPTNAFTIEAWVYPTDCTTRIAERIFSKWDGNSLGTDDGAIIFDTYDGTNGCGIDLLILDSGDVFRGTGNSGDVLTLNTWNYVAATFLDGAMTTYVNAVQKTTGSLGESSIQDSTFLWGIGEDGSGPGSNYETFTGNIDEVRFSTFSRSPNWLEATYANQNSPDTFYTIAPEESIYFQNNPIITPNSAIAFSTLSGFVETSVTNGGSIKYQISNNGGANWYWYNSGWVEATGGYSESSTATVINSNIATFPVGSKSFLFRAYLHSDGTQLVKLDTIQLTFTYDTTAPAITLAPISPDPTSDSTPSITGVSVDSESAISNIQFQVDSKVGSWVNCTAADNVFDELSENFVCDISTSQTQGTHTVYVRAIDVHGNTTDNASVPGDTFVIDSSAPTGSVSINNGSSTTSGVVVNLTITASDIYSSVTQMKISEDSEFSGASYESYATSKSFSLSSGSGTKTVYVKFLDSAGNESSTYFDEIILSTASSNLLVNEESLTSNEDLSVSQISDLVELADVTLKVIDENGGPLALAKVEIEDLKLKALTDENGELILGSIPVKDYIVQITYESNIFSKILKLSKNSRVVIITVNSNTTDITVKVVDAEGNAVENAKVTLHSTPKVSYTDKNGVAYFSNVETGEHKVEIEYNGENFEQSLTVNLTSKDTAYQVMFPNKLSESSFPVVQLALVAMAVLVVLFILRKFFPKSSFS